MSEKVGNIDRLSDGDTSSGQQVTHPRPSERKVHDDDVTFEEYVYYAKRTREEQKALEAPVLIWRQFFQKLGKKSSDNSEEPHDVKAPAPTGVVITDDEWTSASRAFRTASWGAVFYLITTDILGPFAVPYAMGSLGFGPGVAIFTTFGLACCYGGWLIWRVYMGVDSFEFPARNYGDIAFRAWGKTARHITNVLQAVALLLLLGQVTILFGQNISEMSKSNLCYIVCPLIFVIIGFFLTQIRTLRNYGWIANFGFWLNIAAILVSMIAIGINPPNYAISTLGSVGTGSPSIVPVNGVYPAVQTFAGIPSSELFAAVNGMMSGVLAYAGLQLYIEFMAEMRRPHDFLKGMFVAQAVIYICYVVYGCFVYYYQGQYTFNPSYLGTSSYGWQTAANVLTLISGLIAAGLYGNIGIKVFYNNVLIDICNAPLMTTRAGKIFYAIIVPIWWSIAFIIAASIPAYAYFVGIMSASTLLNLTYTIPPWVALGFDIRRHTMGQFDPSTGRTNRGLTGVNRYIKGFWMGGTFQVCMNIWNTIQFLASLSLCGLGMWAGIVGMINAFKIPEVTAFTCTSPLNLNS